MKGIELNKCAISIAKVLKALSNLDSKIKDAYSLQNSRDELLIMAYISRVNILDRIQSNPWMVLDLPITIATGLFSTRKETIASALHLTVGKIIKLAEYDVETESLVEDIFEKGPTFYEIEGVLPAKVIEKFR
jgi:hypothetical protein